MQGFRRRLPEERRVNPKRAWYRFAQRLLPPPEQAGRWIDAGCGRGEFLEFSAQLGLHGIGLDREIDPARTVAADSESTSTSPWIAA